MRVLDYRIVAILSWSFASIASIPAHASIAGPSLLEANIGPLPVDKYSSVNFDATLSVPYVKNCSTSSTVRSCIQTLLTNYASQNVTAIRFMFAMCGGGFSTALSGCGTGSVSYNSTWRSQLLFFLQDVKAAGINKVIPTPMHWSFYNQYDQYCPVSNDYTCGDSNGNYTFLTNARVPSLNDGLKWQITYDACTSTNVPLFFWPTAPFPVRGANTVGHPTGPWMMGNDDSYNCAPANPFFVGWNNIYIVYDATLSAVQQAGLLASEFDITNEIDLAYHTSMGRMVVDNVHTATINPRPLEAVRYYMNYYGFNYLDASYSVGDVGTTLGYSCTSIFGDSARIIRQSALTSAIAGGLFGTGAIAPQNGLACLATPFNTSGMVSTSYPFVQPQLIDFHTYIAGGPLESKLLFDFIFDFYDSFSPSGWRGYNYNLFTGRFVVGETHSNVTSSPCMINASDASNVVSGFNGSDLAGRTPHTIFRPWNNVQEIASCYPIPHAINPPYTPQP